ncbi:MAG TPA: AtpZ/AtpI family protein [Microbacterium sp.]|jgi:F0F1-type ATP synthase assembly protein I|nr:AtpZ/AtpI family protein [Microbacterium sp.]
MAGSGPELGDLLSMGLTLALCVVLGFGLGWLGDLATGTFPLLAMVGLALGVALAVVYVVKQFKRYS